MFHKVLTSLKTIKNITMGIRSFSIVILLVFQSFIVYSQKEYLPNEEDLSRFFNSRTYVVLETSPMSDYNFEIKEQMNNIWELTEFEFIENDEFPAASKDPYASFLYTTLVSFEKDKTDSRYVFIHLSMGHESATLDDMKDLVSVPLGYAGVPPENYIYKLGTLIKFIQNHVKLIRENPSVISSNVFDHYNKNIKSAHSKTVLFVKEELSPELRNEKELSKYYPYSFKITDREAIREAILSQDENIVFLHKVGPEGKKMDARSYKMLIGAGDSQFYYFDYHKVNPKKPDGFLSSDLKRLAR